MADTRDLRAQAHELLAVLDATETYLRVTASTHLPYDSVVRIERAAVARARGLVGQLGLDEPLDEGTDELLALAVAPTPLHLGASVNRAEAEPSWVAYDEAPAGAKSEDEDQPSWLAEESPAYVEEDTHNDSPGAAETERPSWLADEEPEEEPPSYLPEEATPAHKVTPSPTDDLALEELEPEDPEEPDTLVLEVPEEIAAQQAQGSPIDFGEVSEDALVTMDEVEPLELDELVLEPLDLEDTAAGPAPEEIVALRNTPPPAERTPAPAGRSTDDVETFDLIPDLSEDDLVIDGFDEEPVVEELDDLMEVEVDVDEDFAPSSPRTVAPVAVQPAGVSVRSTPRGAPQVTPGLYGGAAVPTIREGDAPRPRAAAIQINAGGGTSRVVGLEEEEEPIAIGAAEDYGEELDYEDEDAGGGFRLAVQEYVDEVEEYEEEEEDAEVVQPVQQPPPPAAPVGPTQSEIVQILERARQAAEAGDMQRGADLYSDVIDADPENVEAHVGRGRLYLDLGDYTRAMSDFMLAEDMAPESPEPQIAIGDLYFARKDYRKAIEYFNAALQMSPNHAMAFCRRGISHYYRKNYRDSLADLQKAQELDREIPNISTYIAMAKKKAKR